MNITTMPRLSAVGHELDTSPEAFGELRDSSDIAGDFPALRERMAQDGCLYLPGYLGRERVLEARAEITRRLAAEGCLDPAYPVDEAVPLPGGPMGMKANLAKDNVPLHRVLYDGPMMEFYAGFLGGPVRHFDYTWLRAIGPGIASAPHLDIVYMGRGTKNLFTAWTPYGDTPVELGGLMILENSHRHQKLRDNYGTKDVDAVCTNKRGSAGNGTLAGSNIGHNGSLSKNPFTLRRAMGGRWLTTNYRAGDFITFGMYTVHCGLDNGSHRIRLSSDTRYQLASEPIDERWIGENPIAHGPNAKRGMIC